jgi:hypothetical protein
MTLCRSASTKQETTDVHIGSIFDFTHELENEVNISIVVRSQNIVQSNDICMIAELA